MKFATTLIAFVLAFFLNVEIIAQNDEAPEEETPLAERIPGDPMTLERLEAIIMILDADAQRTGNGFTFRIDAGQARVITTIVVTDPAADRMRILVAIAEETVLSGDRMKRILQANFDSALDARYAIAQGVLWSTFIHPLSSLGDEEFLSGLSQTVTLAVTFGSTYSSGAMVFGGGDSQGILEDLMEEYLRRLKPQA